MQKRVFILIFLIAVLCVNIYSQDTVSLLFRILKFERSLKNRAKGKVHIAVVYNNEKRYSALEAINIAGEINKFSDEKIQNLDVSHGIFIVDDKIDSKIKDSSIIYIAKGVNEREIMNIAKKHKILTVAQDKQYIKKVGIVILKEEEENKFHINVKILKEEGVNIAQELLAISKIYK
ncbi:MAG: YfiR family protein [Candidatus Mcinerneyibacterium aminivorans]|uniref:YfiR family protein n=1 Tax=Candidatus Mcinerneyibacterium aminivorans TaxID=2703815 RepID=A0A5D0MN57_9BACT|nr:MAG: YfiR family protein [Candidatus Mcinerneyibacterium aminivorans]